MVGNTSANLRLYSLKQEILENNQNLVNKPMSRVLVICTGGTLTMVHTPKGYMSQKGFVNRLKIYSNLYDKEFSEQMRCESNECITPVTPFDKRIFYKVVEFDELLDSSNLTIADQVEIALRI
jgi:lysophospholipase